MSDPIKIALIAALPPTLAVLWTAFRSWAKLDVIHTLTNSTLTAANKRIDELEMIVKRMVKERDDKNLQ